MKTKLTHRRWVENSVSISEFRRNPSRCFLHDPVEVMSRGRTVGYLIDPELFEKMLEALARHEKPATLKKELGLTDDWLREVTDENR